MFVGSLASKYPELELSYNIIDAGYEVGFSGEYSGYVDIVSQKSDSLYFAPDYMYLALPGIGTSTATGLYITYVNSGGRLGQTAGSGYNYYGFRPVVCLKSGVTLEKVGDEQYNLIAP